MANFKKYPSLFLALIACFNLGAYTALTIKHNEQIDLYRWILTSLFGLMFLITFLIENNKK